MLKEKVDRKVIRGKYLFEDENVSPEQKKDPRRQQLLRTIIQAVSKLFQILILFC